MMPILALVLVGKARYEPGPYYHRAPLVRQLPKRFSRQQHHHNEGLRIYSNMYIYIIGQERVG